MPAKLRPNAWAQSRLTIKIDYHCNLRGSAGGLRFPLRFRIFIIVIRTEDEMGRYVWESQPLIVWSRAGSRREGRRQPDGDGRWAWGWGCVAPIRTEDEKDRIVGESQPLMNRF